jgi:hypothetical protein
MNFFDFLEKHSSENQTITNPHKTKQDPSINQTHVSTNTFKAIRNGDMVRIIHLPNSPYNVYKGYLAEIREYKNGSEYARLFLHAVSHHNNIKLPLDHFTLL